MSPGSVRRRQQQAKRRKSPSGTSQRIEEDAGRAARESIPFEAHREFRTPDRDPAALIERQNASRIPELGPLRMERMLAGPYAFFRGTAELMAIDLADGATTGTEIVICGDAHIENFGFYASPERSIVFDINDFDESATGPWEWDLKRLVTSVVLAGQEHAHPPKMIREAARAAAAGYREQLRELVRRPAIERFSVRSDAQRWATVVRAKEHKILDATVAKAGTRTTARAVARLTVVADGERRFIDDPPRQVRLGIQDRSVVTAAYADYLASARNDVAHLLEQFAITDIARRAVGVGSVGTRCLVLLLRGPVGESLILQMKEALPSVVESSRGRSASVVQGQRVVEAQRILQAVSDPFLGYIRLDDRDFYIRQLQDMKGSIDVAGLSPRLLGRYGWFCGRLLARGHAQSVGASFIAGYLGASDAFDRAVAGWSADYARQVTADYTAAAAELR